METKQDSSAPAAVRNRRRQMIVDKPMQSRIVFVATWPTAACLAAASLLLGVFCNRLYSEALQAEVELPSILPVFVVCAVFLVTAGLFVVFSAIKLSHRIAGPIYNVGRTLERFAAGDQEARIRLRTGDYLFEVANHVNAHLDWVAPQLSRTESAPADSAAVDEPGERIEVGAPD